MHAVKWKALIGSVSCAIGMLVALPGTAQSLEKIKVRLDWTPWAVHAPMHLAQEKGWFKKAGLDVTVEDGNGSTTTVQLIGTSGQFDIGHAVLSTMMVGRDKGLPVKALTVFMRKSDMGLVIPKDSDIKGPGDLKGKKVNYTAGSSEASFVDPFLAAGGLKRSDIELISIEGPGKVSNYAAGRADGVIVPVALVLPFVANTRPSKAVLLQDFGLPMLNYGLIASESKLAEKRDAIKRFASIVSGAWQYIYDGNQEEAVDAIIAQRPQARLDKEILLQQLAAMRPFFDSKYEGKHPIGVFIPEEWDDSVKTLADAGVIKPGSKGASYYEPDMVRHAIFDKVKK